ncbi:thioesterase-like superfamily-domain-containing protein [Penicillium angulare]|uniref:thioesterase-like superfamily-domain-containing protein n=1 Tax=Penicillium angulare TaxID=116970 RepID=UPI00253FA456|nr:thioesterase-like superfamily-domain-containing protein [Penicillium angulare]KAJ5279066.1 thioesterase-like superfamily-domain-containing protein [Penicillium angulare]
MKSPIENIIEVTPLSDESGNIFTNSCPLWSPPGARGVYGGALIAHSLAASQRMISDDFIVHSMHSLFIFAGAGGIPVTYEVKIVHDAGDRITQVVHAKQETRLIFIATISFMRSSQTSMRHITHSIPKLDFVPPTIQYDNDKLWDADRPFETIRIPLSFVARAHQAPRHSSASGFDKIQDLENGVDEESKEAARFLRRLAEQEMVDFESLSPIDEQMGMMVSLSHSIYFHHQESFRADDWMLSEMSSPWAGEGRGLVYQSCWSQSGLLIATCVQEVDMPLIRRLSIFDRD